MAAEAKKNKGHAFRFGAPRGDKDRLAKVNYARNNTIDNAHRDIERVAWNMRPRNKMAEI